ncbi:MAG: glycosyltransferase [Planctomycetota bacterium]
MWIASARAPLRAQSGRAVSRTSPIPSCSVSTAAYALGTALIASCRPAAEAIARGSNLALHCVGSGPYRESLENALGGDRWHVTDWCSGEELAEHVAGFDILALGYDPGEACYFSPLKLREGMAAGAVPVVPDLGSLADDVQQGRAGLIYDPVDPTALRQAIERLAGDAPLRAKLAAAAREAAHRHSWAAIAREVLRRSLGVPQ